MAYKQRWDFKQKLRPSLKLELRLKRALIYVIVEMIAGAGADVVARAVAVHHVVQAVLTLAAADPCAAVSNLEVVRLLSHKMYAYEV